MESNLIVTLVVLLVGTGGVACRPAPPPAPIEDKALEAWLTCEECSNGELEAVIRLGQPLVPRLANGLQAGPSQPSIDAARARLAAAHKSLVAYATSHPEAPVPMSERDYVERHVENFIVLYQSRAATALGALGGPVARGELTKAQALPLRPQVQAVVREALLRIQ